MQSASKPCWKPYKIFIQSCTIFFSLFHQLPLTFPIPFHQHRNQMETKTNHTLFGIQENSSQYIKLSGYSFPVQKTWMFTPWCLPFWCWTFRCPTFGFPHFHQLLTSVSDIVNSLMLVTDTDAGHYISDWHGCGTLDQWLTKMWDILLVTDTDVGHFVGDWHGCGTLHWRLT